jgi:hypothetical protein
MLVWLPAINVHAYPGAYETNDHIPEAFRFRTLTSPKNLLLHTRSSFRLLLGRFRRRFEIHSVNTRTLFVRAV